MTETDNNEQRRSAGRDEFYAMSVLLIRVTTWWKSR
jgi:hypothetical protein